MQDQKLHIYCTSPIDSGQWHATSVEQQSVLIGRKYDEDAKAPAIRVDQMNGFRHCAFQAYLSWKMAILRSSICCAHFAAKTSNRNDYIINL
eukprot:5000870-Amphidinium_carterae.1